MEHFLDFVFLNFIWLSMHVHMHDFRGNKSFEQGSGDIGSVASCDYFYERFVK